MKRWLAVVLAVVMVTLGLGAWKLRQIQAAMAMGAAYPERVEAVEVVAAQARLWQPETTVTGDVVAVRAVNLVNELSGRIVAVGFSPGARVQQGQVLVQQDITEEQAQLAAAEADAALARLDLARAQRLIASGSGTEEGRDQARARRDAAAAAVARLQAMIDKKTLRAPFAAKAGLHELEAGQYLDAGSQITRLIGLTDQVWVDFSLPQQQASLALGDQVTVSTLAAQQPQQPQQIAGTIIGLDGYVDANARNLRYRALLEQPSQHLVPGSLVRVALPVGPAQQVVLVPVSAVRYATFGASVFLLEPAEAGAGAPERAVRRPVQIGSQQGDLVVVTSGLMPGQRVAANGAFKLRDGVLVRGVEPASAAELAAAEGN